MPFPKCLVVSLGIHVLLNVGDGTENEITGLGFMKTEPAGLFDQCVFVPVEIGR